MTAIKTTLVEITDCCIYFCHIYVLSVKFIFIDVSVIIIFYLPVVMGLISLIAVMIDSGLTMY